MSVNKNSHRDNEFHCRPPLHQASELYICGTLTIQFMNGMIIVESVDDNQYLTRKKVEGIIKTLQRDYS